MKKRLSHLTLSLFLFSGTLISCSNSPLVETEIIEQLVVHESKGSNTIVPTESIPHLLFNSGIRSILLDSKGNMWFGSHQDGVCKWDGKSHTYYTKKDGLSNNQVRTIQEHADGSLWFGTGNGISSFRNGVLKNETQKMLGDAYLNVTWSNYPTDLWFHTEDRKGAYRYNGKQLEFLPFPASKDKTDGSSYLITGISKGKSAIWFATYSGVYSFSNGVLNLINNESLGLDAQKGIMHVRSILEDSKGRLWIGNNGIGVLVDEGSGIYNFTEEYSLKSPNGFPGGNDSPEGTLEHVFSIGEDQQGNIWFGDRDTGVWRFDGTQMKNYGTADGLPQAMIWDIYMLPNGKLLFGADDGGVYQFNGDSFVRSY